MSDALPSPLPSLWEALACGEALARSDQRLRGLEDLALYRRRGVLKEKGAWMTRNEAIEEALVTIAHRQLRTLDMLREQGFVFTSIGHEKGNWQHLAFTLYTELCEVDHIAREALKVKG